jgi:hypothetical protein
VIRDNNAQQPSTVPAAARRRANPLQPTQTWPAWVACRKEEN